MTHDGPLIAAPDSEVTAVSAPAEPFAYEPALDGIRALAVIGVLLYHGGLSFARAGFLGVDVFFVLSGFLITMLLMRELGAVGRIDLRAFYTRRARRLLPAVFALLLAVSAYAFLFASAPDRARIRSDGLASLFYVQNWHLIFTGQSYFDQFAAPSPLRHMWSLAIEEQWYLLWPVLLTGLVRVARGRRVRVAAFACTLAAASAVAMALLYHRGTDPSRVYYGTDTRAQELLIGAALAAAWPALARRRGAAARVALQILAAIGAVFIVRMVHWSNDASSGLYRGGIALVAIASAAVIAGAMSPGPTRSILATPPLPTIGRISYGLYLWHWPLFLVLSPNRLGFEGLALFAVRAAATLAVAVASFRFVELPIRTRRKQPAPRSIGWIPATAVVITGCLFVGGSSLGFGKRGNTLNGDAIARYAAAIAGLQRQPTPESLRVFVAGDSVAFFLAYYGVAPELRERISLSGRPIIGCGIARGDIVSNGVTHAADPACDHWPRDYQDAMLRSDPDVTVLLTGAWEVYDRKIGGQVLKVGTPAMEAYLRTELERATAILTSNGAPLVLLSTPCFELRTGGISTWGLGERNSAARIGWFNDVLLRYAGEHPQRVTFLDLHAIMCPNGRYQNRIGGVATRADGMHFTPEGATMAWRWLAPQLEPLGKMAEPFRRRQQKNASAPSTAPTPPPAASQQKG